MHSRITRLVMAITCLVGVAVAIDARLAAVYAQTILLRDITVKKLSQAGSLSGCAVNFEIGFQDHAYRRGQASVVSGALTWYLRPLGAWATIEVVGQDISEDATTMGFHVTNAFIDVETTTYLADEQSSCENPQGFCAVYHSDKAMRLLHSAIPTFVLGFNRQENGMGHIRLPIAVDGPKQREMAECVDALAGSAPPQQP
jgi:hypothetical protein